MADIVFPAASAIMFEQIWTETLWSTGRSIR
jgi:hypothetical protein